MIDVMSGYISKRQIITVTSYGARWRFKSPASRLFTQPFIQGADQRKHQSSASLSFVRGIHRWIPHTKGQWHGRCFIMMTSSRSELTRPHLIFLCLAEPSHYMNQCWLLINEVCGIYMRAISQRLCKLIFSEMILKFILFKSLLHFAVPNCLFI